MMREERAGPCNGAGLAVERQAPRAPALAVSQAAKHAITAPCDPPDYRSEHFILAIFTCTIYRKIGRAKTRGAAAKKLAIVPACRSNHCTVGSNIEIVIVHQSSDEVTC